MTYTIVDELAYKFYGDFFYRSKVHFEDLKVKIRHSHIPMSVDQYLASAFMYSVIVGIAGGAFGLWLGMKIFGNPVSRLSLFGNAVRADIAGKYVYPLAILAGLVLFLISFFAVFLIVYIYPYFQANNRQAAIDKSMLPAITYMYALTKGGMSIYDVFRSLSKYTYIFGATAEEVSYVVRDMDYLGKDFISALKIAKDRTPSEVFKDFVDGLIIVSSSGAITEYIKNKSEQYQGMAALANKNLLQRLDVLAEIYVTALVAGPLFVMVTIVVMQFFQPASSQILYMLIYVILPLATLLYLVLLDTVGELSIDPKKGGVRSFTINLAEIPEIDSGISEEKEQKRRKMYRLYRELNNIKDMMLNPYRTIRDEPRYTFLFGVPLGLYYLTQLPRSLKHKLYLSFHHLSISFDHVTDSAIKLITAVDDYVVIFIVVILIPYIIFYELKAWRMKKIDEKMPDFLKSLSSMNESGIMLANSLKIIAESKMGILSKELKKVKEDISWGTSTSRALMNLERNIRTPSSSRILHILVKANESTSDLKSVLAITSKQVRNDEDMRQERSSSMVVYVVTIYVSFFVFLFIVYVLATNFFPQTSAFATSSQGMAGIGGYFNVEEYTMLMFHSALVQGFTSGLVAGKMGQGSTYLGLKYSVSMIILAYVVFTMFV